MNIYMTWPMYRRNECRFNHRLISLAPQECKILATLLLNGHRPVNAERLIDELWPNPDTQPETAYNIVRVVICRLRRKVPGLIEAWAPKSGLGYRIELPLEAPLKLAA